MFKIHYTTTDPVTGNLLHSINDLMSIFTQCFYQKYQTLLISGQDEPLYIPANIDCADHQIIFAHGFFSSALHECAHWLIAGPERRKMTDYGYWYVPDGRTADQQALFYQVEVKPQALEWILSDAARWPFQFSLDNLTGQIEDAQAFKQAVKDQVADYLQSGLPVRAEILRAALHDFYSLTIQEVQAFS